MSDYPNEGGPAFPIARTGKGGETTNLCGGMTLRDYFAGQALAGLLSTMDVDHPFYEATTLHMAELSYDYAAAMLAARKEQPHD